MPLSCWQLHFRFSQGEVDGFRESFVSWFERQVGLVCSHAVMSSHIGGFQLSCLMTKAWQGRRMSAGSEAAEQENKQHGESSQQPDSHFFRIFFSVTLCYRRLVFPTHLHPLSHHIACYITSLDPFKTSGLSRISPISASRSFTRSRGHLTEWFWDGLGRVRFLPPSNPLQI